MPVPLLLTLAAVSSAPVLAALLHRAPRWEAFGQGFTVVAVAGLVLLQVAPFGIATSGWAAVTALVAGLLVGQSVHRFPGAEGAARWLASAALLVHGLLDGAALALESPDSAGVGWAVVAHSVPVGLATWRLGASLGGARRAAGLLLLSLGATVGGYFGSEAVLAGTSTGVLAVAQCAVAGTLLHVLAHLGGGEEAPARAGAGGIVGLGVLAAVGAEHPIPRLAAGALSSLDTLLALAPAAFVGLAVGAGLAARLHLRASPRVARWFAVPGAASGFALATALLGPLVAVLAWVATFAGERLARFAFASHDAPSPSTGPTLPVVWREVEAAAPWVAGGLALAALAEPMVDLAAAAGAPPFALAGVAALLATPARVRWALSASLLAVLVGKGLPPGAAVVALVLGEGVHVGALLAAWRSGPARVLALVGAWVVPAFAAGALVDLQAGGAAPGRLGVPSPEAAWVAAAGVGTILALALLRRGPVGFLAPLHEPASTA
jgi:hypothetical protein